MNLKRITRLLKLLQALQAGQVDNADGLARACGVSRRTAFRDLETLKAAGVPLEFDKASDRYSLAAESFLPPSNLTTAEAVALLTLANELGSAQLPFLGAARSAAAKLQAALPAAMRREVQSVAKAIRLRLQPIEPLESQQRVYDQLVTAIAERRIAKIAYQSLTEWETVETRLRPYYLMFNRHSWYVIGRSSLHAEPRTFNLGRIQSIELLSQKFARPRGFSLERYLGNAWSMMPQSGADYHVVVRFAPMVAQNVAAVAWHKTQRLEFQSDGSLHLHVDVSGLSEIVWWILGYGDHAEVLQPEKLRRQIAQRARNMHQLYAAGGDRAPQHL